MLTNNEIKKRVISTMASVFYLDEQTINENTSPDTIKNWDSVGQLNLILALEEEFSTAFTSEQTFEMISLDLIVHVISENLNDE